jgi:hypothetical protein
MVRLTREQRRILADKLPDLANVGAGLLILGQLVGDQPVSIPLFILGTAFWVMLLTLALVVGRNRK